VLSEWLLVALGIALTFGTALFVSSEFSLIALDPGVVESTPGQGDRRGQSVLKALKHLSTELSGAQVGITVTTILLGYTTQPAVNRLLSSVIEPTGLGRAVGGILAAVLAVVLVNGFSMLFGELVPKNFAISHPLGTARTVAPLQRGFTTALRPVIALFNNTANAVLRRFGVEPREGLSGGRSPQELASLVRRSAAVGTLDEATAMRLTNTIQLDQLTAVDVMTDRMRLVVVRRDETAADVVARARESGHSRFPVIDSSPDDIVGLVHLRRAIAVPHERRHDVPAAALMVDALTRLVLPVGRQRQVDDTGVPCHLAPHPGHVGLFRSPLLELLAHMAQCLLVEAHHQDARRVLVEPVRHCGRRPAAAHPRFKAIGQRRILARHAQQPRGLVEHHDILVRMDHRQPRIGRRAIVIGGGNGVQHQRRHRVF